MSVSINLFDKLVRPILTYNSEISFMDYFIVYHRANQRAILRNGNMDHFTLIDRTRPSKIFFVVFFLATIDGRNLIFGHKLHIGMPYCGKRFWTSDSYFLLADLVGFYAH